MLELPDFTPPPHPSDIAIRRYVSGSMQEVSEEQHIAACKYCLIRVLDFNARNAYGAR